MINCAFGIGRGGKIERMDEDGGSIVLVGRLLSVCRGICGGDAVVDKRGNKEKGEEDGLMGHGISVCAEYLGCVRVEEGTNMEKEMERRSEVTNVTYLLRRVKRGTGN